MSLPHVVLTRDEVGCDRRETRVTIHGLVAGKNASADVVVTGDAPIVESILRRLFPPPAAPATPTAAPTT